ncbi:MAG: tetrathionate reductase family octaheme c-type cytochrome [Candidatus Eisenbacteria bacterium]|nr:tetrathionate reductase family octaheme c-type cytochrome [Candidatus Eisenbacteria bacterium]
MRKTDGSDVPIRRRPVRSFVRATAGAAAAALLLGAPAASASADEPAPGRTLARQAVEEREHWNTTDHSKHEELQAEFHAGPEVTRACLSCHTEASLQFHQTIHWTWADPFADPAKRNGKGGWTVNNFCINIHSNEPRCTCCHAGYGWKDDTFDFTDQNRVDCLVCHEQTGTYVKFPAGAGNPAAEEMVFKGNGKTYYPPDWNRVAQSVGRPTRRNCGVCHFDGGGGDGVKHGDLDSSLREPNRELDVHMGTDGEDFDCVRCHTTRGHLIAGRIYSTPAAPDRRSLIEDDLAPKIMCESCHSDKPHKPGVKANDHTDKVACQSCHIPTFGRGLPTKMWWDWSKAGNKKDGKPYTEKGPYDRPVYDTKKGEFVWAVDVVPEYAWFNGSIPTLTAADEIDPGSTPVRVSWPLGARSDPNSRIFPFKVHRGKQPYDTENKTFLVPHLFGKPDSDAYWAHYDWQRALVSGQRAAGLPFSGKFDFIETSFVYPTTHMVVPKERSLACEECHADEARLANLTGFYMPGRDRSRPVDVGGWGLVGFSVVAVAVHGSIRFVSYGSRKRKGGRKGGNDAAKEERS